MLNNVEIEISGFKYKYHPIKQLAIDIYGYDSRTMVSEYSFHNYITLYGLYYHPLFKNITYMGTRTNFDNVTIELKDQIKNSVDLELKKIFLNCKSTILEKLFNRFRENRPNNKKLATMTAVRPPARFGAIKFKGNKVSYFKEKSKYQQI